MIVAEYACPECGAKYGDFEDFLDHVAVCEECAGKTVSIPVPAPMERIYMTVNLGEAEE
ncbi:hypothetical protein [Sporosarcina sp. SAFN-015]|uniref:hypothetical protein n=1 Tax=Sporosarcina sp. SAFN-015 TaxID=3387274 RepID=UPI003F7E9D8B